MLKKTLFIYLRPLFFILFDNDMRFYLNMSIKNRGVCLN
jgi:hypothetical protein